MQPFAKTAMALALVGAVTAGAASTASARSWKPWAAAGAGFVAGAAVGSALAAPRYYEPGYASGYAYEPGYAAYDAYAYQPGVAYETTVVAPRYYGGYSRQDAGYRSCATQGNYGGKTDYGAC